MPSLIKKLPGRAPSLPRIPEPSDSSEDDVILQSLGPNRNRIAWSGDSTFTAISSPQDGQTDTGQNAGPRPATRGILRGPTGRGAGNSTDGAPVNSTRGASGSSQKPSSSAAPTRPRYNRTPVRMTVAGDWALKECEVSLIFYFQKCIKQFF